MMLVPADRRTGNVLLQTLSDASFVRISPFLHPCQLPLRLKLSEPGRDCPWVYFPTSGVASVVGRVGTDWQEIGLFGQDGAGCLSGVIGNTKPPYLIVMQVPGAGYRISAPAFAQLFAEDADFRGVMLRYVQAFVIQVAQSSIANCQYNTAQRMALWLLMLHDRMDGNSLCLTHEYIASTLGVGRTGVTLALHSLEESGMIRTARKRITIVSRERLEAMTAAVYGFAESEYRKLLGPMKATHHANAAAG